MGNQAIEELIDQEKKTLMKLERWSMIEESALRQKSRAKWIKLGDANNKYFSAVIKERAQRKHIRSITSLNGQTLYDHKDVQNEIAQFYKGLMGTSANDLPAIDIQKMMNRPTLTRQQRIALCAPITDEEIYEGLKAIGDDKAPGIDRYNAFFFKHTWKIIKKDIIAAVQSFFSTGRMYKPVNCTLVILIPKVQCPNTVKEYRPITCCSALYKIISKVLAKRIHDIIRTIISESQAAFIPGRNISDNIILAHELVRVYTRKNVSPRCMLKIDLQKAYDCVEWCYLEQVMKDLGFHDMLTKWVLTCVKTVS